GAPQPGTPAATSSTAAINAPAAPRGRSPVVDGAIGGSPSIFVNRMVSRIDRLVKILTDGIVASSHACGRYRSSGGGIGRERTPRLTLRPGGRYSGPVGQLDLRRGHGRGAPRPGFGPDPRARDRRGREAVRRPGIRRHVDARHLGG